MYCVVLTVVHLQALPFNAALFDRALSTKLRFIQTVLTGSTILCHTSTTFKTPCFSFPCIYTCTWCTHPYVLYIRMFVPSFLGGLSVSG